MGLQNPVTSIIVHAPIFFIPLKFSDPRERFVTKTLKISVRTDVLGAYIQSFNFYVTTHDCWNIDLWTNQYLDSQKLSVHPVAKYPYALVLRNLQVWKTLFVLCISHGEITTGITISRSLFPLLSYHSLSPHTHPPHISTLASEAWNGVLIKQFPSNEGIMRY